LIERARSRAAVPIAVGFGIGIPEQARTAAEAGADGVIIGSRLVRAAADGEDPAEAVGALVREFAAALGTAAVE
jgi:tryptophan synthase alpha chain